MLKTHGGECKEKYRGTSTDMTLKTHGGEGKNMKKSGKYKLLTPNGTEYCGPGKYLKVGY